ncbi:hypothetical protein CYL31_09425 [Marinomonas sp. A3A]|uniref:hypothetical protein n=1 Tax=Marinomonas sp. A3A TaxID=2065312 RepID=UPI001BB2F4E4|nr:hypothetical protein [Marinomonas sp. A3A]QUX91617.1 hypothetical protein CYL31_09425 [Marinomonas sp. A3A]
MEKNAKIWITLTGLVFTLAGLVIEFGAWRFPVNSSSNMNSAQNVVYGSHNVVNSSVVTTNIVNNGNSSVNIVNSPIQSLFPTSESIQSHTEALPEKMNNTPTLFVSGANAEVKILIGPDDAPFSGGQVSSANAESTIYVSRGQKINLKLTGSNANVWVQSELMPYINVNNSASGGSVREL